LPTFVGAPLLCQQLVVEDDIDVGRLIAGVGGDGQVRSWVCAHIPAFNGDMARSIPPAEV
jgi:hypothetical protein